MQHLTFPSRTPFHHPSQQDGEEVSSRVTVIDPDSRRRAEVAFFLSGSGYVADPFEGPDELADHMPTDCLMLVADEGDLVSSIVALLRARRRIQPFLAYAPTLDPIKMVHAMRKGAVDYFLWPDGKALLLKRAVTEAKRSALVRRAVSGDQTFSIGDNDLATLAFFKDGRRPEEAEALLATTYARAEERASELLSALHASDIDQAMEVATAWRELERQILAEVREADALGRIETLTAREREVFTAMGQGLSSKEVARRLGISCRTVETHRSAIFSKIKARNLAEAMRVAIFSGLV